MLFGHLLTGSAQIFSDVRTYWSPEAVQRVTGWKPSGDAAGGFIHLINSGATTMDGTGRQRKDGKPMKPYWEITPGGSRRMPRRHQLALREPGLLPRRRLFLRLPHRGRHERHDDPPQPRKRHRPGPSDRRRLHHRHPRRSARQARPPHQPHLAHHLVRPAPHRHRAPFKDVYSVMAAWGANHGAISCGHIGADLVSLASILRIPVCMHNVGPAASSSAPATGTPWAWMAKAPTTVPAKHWGRCTGRNTKAFGFTGARWRGR